MASGSGREAVPTTAREVAEAVLTVLASIGGVPRECVEVADVPPRGARFELRVADGDTVRTFSVEVEERPVEASGGAPRLALSARAR